MTPSSPFHPPGNHPHPFFSYTGNLGVIGEPAGSRRQTPTPEAAVAQAGSNGEILLQRLQQGGVGVVGSGTGFGKSVGDGRYPGGQHSAAEDGGAGASWAADPALAALGPGHPYHQHKQQQLQQQQQQQKAITPEDILQSALLKQQAHHGIPAGQANFQHPAFYGAGVGQATAPAGRAPQVFHQHQPAVPVLPQSFSSRYGGKHIVNELHRNPEPSWVASQQVRQVAPEPGNPLGGRSWAAPPPAAQQQQHQRLPQAQFHGNGPELLQLLLGSAGGGQVVVSSSPALRAVDLGKPTGQKPAPPVMHGPIGPPKRSEVPADDALGRSWSTSSSSSNGGLDLGSAPGSLHPEALSFDRSALRERLLQSGDLRPPVGVDRHGGDLRILGSSLLPKDLGLLPESEPSGYPFPSILLPESLELKDGNTFGWMGLEEARIFAEREVPQGLAQLQRVMGNHLTHGRVREIYLKNPRALEIHVPSSVGLPDAHENQYKEQFDSESSRELSRDMMRGGRRPVNTVARAEAGRRGGRNSAGQWVVVNDRQREKDVEAVHSAIAGAKDQVESLDKGQYVIGNLQVSKDENRLRSEEGGQQKVRDDLKRRRGQQQEWRMKQPTHGSIQTFRHVSDPQSLDGVQSPSRALKDVNGNGASAPSQAPSLTSQLDHPGLPVSNVSGSTPGSALEESLHQLNGVEGRGRENGYSYLFRELTGSDDYIGKEEEEELLREFSYLDMADEQETTSLHDSSKPLTGGSALLKAREEGEQLSQYPRRGTSRADLLHRPIVEDFTPQLLNIYDSLIPLEDEEKRRRKFLSHLDNIVAQEWPGARLFLFGSCANAFGVCNSDIDICLSVNDEQTGKAELVTRMASILRLHSMQNVQALTHARVPIVKFTDSVTGISCDICVNNMLAVVNSKLLHDYSKVDVRLRQLAFIVKHWAKRRQVNETYRGTLSSYAYVLMCIHFLQQRQPAILPCLQQGMPITYKVKIGRVECAYYDKVETLTNFGSQNKEGLGELVTAFFEYWAFHHDYNRAVISVRTGTFLSKDQKDWTRRVGNERHLICIEDPFEVTHDLGRIVDRHSIRVLRDEFYRAAKIMRHEPNACVTLFEPFIRQ